MGSGGNNKRPAPKIRTVTCVLAFLSLSKPNDILNKEMKLDIFIMKFIYETRYWF